MFNRNTFKKRILFVGIPDMAYIGLDGLLMAGVNVVGVLGPKKDHNMFYDFKSFVLSRRLNYIDYDELDEAELIQKVKDLDVDALVSIITEPKNALLKQYQSLFKMDNVTLDFSEEAVRRVAELTIEKETGARGLRALMEKILVPVMYSVPSDPTVDVVKITADVVDGKAEPVIARKTPKDETQAS